MQTTHDVYCVKHCPSPIYIYVLIKYNSDKICILLFNVKHINQAFSI